MTLDPRARTHIRALAQEFAGVVTSDPDEAPATMFLSGVVTGLAAAVQIADGATGEKAAEDIVQRISASIGQAVLDGLLPAVDVREHCGEPSPDIGHSTLRTECVLRPGHQGSHAASDGRRWWYDPAAKHHPGEPS